MHQIRHNQTGGRRAELVTSRVPKLAQQPTTPRPKTECADLEKITVRNSQ